MITRKQGGECHERRETVFLDFTDNELLRRQIFEEMNLLIDGEALEPWQAGQKAAFALGYDIPDDVAKTIIVRVRGLSEDELKEFSEDEVKSIVSGESHLPACNC